MLILSRKLDESVLIGNSIEVTVVAMNKQGFKVKIINNNKEYQRSFRWRDEFNITPDITLVAFCRSGAEQVRVGINAPKEINIVRKEIKNSHHSGGSKKWKS